MMHEIALIISVEYKVILRKNILIICIKYKNGILIFQKNLLLEKPPFILVNRILKKLEISLE